MMMLRRVCKLGLLYRYDSERTWLEFVRCLFVLG